ncbi:septum formation initiator family protein [Ornithinimicrobium sp. LYQ103]|uniref:FtsB family cell division protein n=1 Tax=Ornithinimicrobium sp. LYQ103 TaxID=3378796 RepID=UPI00385499F5
MSATRGPRTPRTPAPRGSSGGPGAPAGRAPRRGSSRPAPSRRPGARPGVRGVAGAGASAATSVRRAPAHVRRMLGLLVLVVVMSLVVAPVLSGYLRQRAEITAARQQLVQEQQEIDQLEQELAKWDDKDYVEQQARERLRFVKEGETAFTVIDDTGTDYTEALPGMAPVSDEVLTASPWYGQVWESVKIANEGLPETKEP